MDVKRNGSVLEHREMQSPEDEMEQVDDGKLSLRLAALTLFNALDTTGLTRATKPIFEELIQALTEAESGEAEVSQIETALKAFDALPEQERKPVEENLDVDQVLDDLGKFLEEIFPTESD